MRSVGLLTYIQWKTKTVKMYKRLQKKSFKVVGEPIEIFSDEDTACLSVVEKYLDGLG